MLSSSFLVSHRCVDARLLPLAFAPHFSTSISRASPTFRRFVFPATTPFVGVNLPSRLRQCRAVLQGNAQVLRSPSFAGSRTATGDFSAMLTFFLRHELRILGQSNEPRNQAMERTASRSAVLLSMTSTFNLQPSALSPAVADPIGSPGSGTGGRMQRQISWISNRKRHLLISRRLLLISGILPLISGSLLLTDGSHPRSANWQRLFAN